MHSSQITESKLRQPDTAASHHSAAVAAFIRERIDSAGGVLPFDEYMEAALYAPGLGYYAASSRKFGPGGDFVTAPELGPLFGQCLAREVGPVLASLKKACVLEFGAGSGALAVSLIEALSRLDQLPERYCILEISPDLRERQRKRLEPIANQHRLDIKWLERMPDAPLEGVILANEVVDAFPVTRFRVRNEKPVRAGVCINGDGFAWDWIDDLGDDQSTMSIFCQYQLKEGYTSEVCHRSKAWMGALASALQRGVVLVIDYGFPAAEYYLPERSEGTLRCHYLHQAHNDPLIYPGIQDVTSHVNFSALADAGRESGLEVLGYTSQEAYLLGLGLLELASAQPNDDEKQMLKTAAEVKELILPSQMGEAFKVMAFGRQADKPLQGFKLRDRSGSL